jgi:hypothetical protein
LSSAASLSKPMRRLLPAATMMAERKAFNEDIEA